MIRGLGLSFQVLPESPNTEAAKHAMHITLPQLNCVRFIANRLSEQGRRAMDVTGLWGSAKTLAAVQAAEALGAPLLILTAGRIEAESIFDDLTAFAGPDRALLLPSWEVLPSDAMDPSDDIVAERMNTLQHLASAFEDALMCAAVPLRSMLQYVAPREDLERRTVRLAVGEEYDLDDLLLRLTKLGYERELMVEQRGQMSVRGGIFDVFPISSELPFRIEFFGDEIESIRRFEPETQRSIGPADSVALLPRSEKHLLHERKDALATLADYFPPNTLVALDEPLAIAEEARKLEEQFGVSEYIMPWEDAYARLEAFRQLRLMHVAQDAGAERIAAPVRSMSNWEPPATDFWQQLEQWDRKKYTVALICNNTGERTRLLELLDEHGYQPDKSSFDLRIYIGRIHAGFDSYEDNLAILSEREVFGRHYIRRSRRRFEAGSTITALGDLKSGDFVVHASHGVGRYLGMRRFPDKTGDFLVVQYAKGDTLYLPVTQIDAIQKFSGGDGAMPKIDRLGGATWARTKARVKKAVKDMANELLQLYAARESQEGHAFAPDSPWQIEFEDAFPYEETPDQARAITDVKRDMESIKPMDRLVCGDVGYGKTEVALRAAFKTVQDGKQAALLVPTTVLAEQHYLNFVERLADFPVRVDLLCRFRGPKEQKETIEKLKSGDVDIVVGTHRLISKDIEFKDLGLLIIDEEHRFGVAQKERLKQVRNIVDVLTMTATPIPRTLNLSMLGVRDMSLINTAPNDRLPVHTCIEPFGEDLIREALERELSRQGQVFFVHNRVQTIELFATLVEKLAPRARVAIGHGQMREGDLEHVMTRFIRHEIDVLVCTTIIGSGIDIPNANTIIINDADRFGLSELYQLRGRVGRYKHRAFAYLLVNGDKALTEVAQKRLKALEDFSTLGAGFRIAMADMEIRGCGNILGGEQHGHIATVGLETYSQLLQETIAELKGEPVVHRVLPAFDMAVDAHIPEAYVPSEAQKLTLYKRIASAMTVEEVDEMNAEIADRFGPIPAPVKRLIDIMRIRAQAADLGVKRIAAAKTAIAVEFESARFLNRASRTALSQHFGPRIQYAFQGDPCITYTPDADTPDRMLIATKNLLKALSEV